MWDNSGAIKPGTSVLSGHGMPTLSADRGGENEARVLIIDDDRPTRRLAANILKSYCQVHEAGSISQGLSSYDLVRPDIVFMDIQLPDGNGQDLLSWIMRRDPSAFIVMVSGYNFASNIIRAVETGARGFVSKPFEEARLLHYIRQYPKLH